LNIALYFSSKADRLQAKTILEQDGWHILGHNANMPILYTIPPPAIAEPLDRQEKTWTEFASACQNRYGAIDYAVVLVAEPAKLNLSLN
jgi:hypothetical protein